MLHEVPARNRQSSRAECEKERERRRGAGRQQAAENLVHDPDRDGADEGGAEKLRHGAAADQVARQERRQDRVRRPRCCARKQARHNACARADDSDYRRYQHRHGDGVVVIPISIHLLGGVQRSRRRGYNELVDHGVAVPQEAEGGGDDEVRIVAGERRTDAIDHERGHEEPRSGRDRSHSTGIPQPSSSRPL
jgi:hypothetical protein